MLHCTLCPISCGAERPNQRGYCGADSLIIAKYGLHLYEEPCISFGKGSGAVFFCGCSLKCRFCQNFELSRAQRGKHITVDELIGIFQTLEGTGAENINLVNPAHYIEELIEAFSRYRPRIPVVYNTHSYEKTEAIERIAPFVDIWLPDLKFYASKVSLRYTGREDYFARAAQAIPLMLQKPLVFREDGKLLSGAIVRHLILPLNTDDSLRLLDWFAPYKEKAYLSLMRQYTPFGDIEAFPELKRKITNREYKKVLDYALSLGIEQLFLQEKESATEEYIPHWDY